MGGKKKAGSDPGISNLTAKNKNFFYRGHANDAWKLQTSFHRAASKNNINMLQYLDVIIPEVHYHVCANHNQIIDLANVYEFAAFLVLIQHHGFPTPLLDWTLSPYIAAYFAFKEVNDLYPASEYVKIYAFDYSEWNTSYKQTNDLRDFENPHVSTIRPFAKFNPRIIHQQGMFTITNIDDIEGHINYCSASIGKQFLYTMLLSVKDKPLVLRELNLMGINQMTLFPNIDGICEALKGQFFSANTVGPTLNEIMQRDFWSTPEFTDENKRPKKRRRKSHKMAPSTEAALP